MYKNFFYNFLKIFLGRKVGPRQNFATTSEGFCCHFKKARFSYCLSNSLQNSSVCRFERERLVL